MYNIVIIGEYYRTLTGENCPRNTIITTKLECEFASNIIGLKFGGGPGTSKERPPGCYWSQRNGKTHLDENAKASNTHLTFSGLAGICKKLAGKYSVESHITTQPFKEQYFVIS